MLSLILGRDFSFSSLIAMIVSSVIVIFVTMPVHEWAHAFAADKLGDRTARWQGRLTLNPMAHINWLGALMILLVGVGFANPVPVNQYNLRKPKRDMAIIGLAGPLANLVVALICTIIFSFLFVFAVRSDAMALYFFASVFNWISYINISLAAFNLIPLPPMDGSRVLFAILPDRIYYKIQQYERYILWAVLACAMIGVLDVPINFIAGIFTNLSNLITRAILGLFGFTFA